MQFRSMTMNEPRRANITAIAEACHISRARALQMLKAANLRKDRSGTYLFAKACEVINSLKDPSLAAGNRTMGRGDGAASGAVATLANAKALAEQFRAKKLELAIAKEEGRLVSREEVETNARNFATFIRSAFLGLGPSIAPSLIGKSADEIARLIDADVRNILERLANVDFTLVDEAF